MKITDKVTDEWFISEPGLIMRILQIYVKGDALVMLPIWILIGISGIFNWKFMLIEIGILLFLRGIGEMIYSLLHQFGKQDYRPISTFKNLSNGNTNVIMQLFGMILAFLGLSLIAYTLLFL